MPRSGNNLRAIARDIHDKEKKDRNNSVHCLLSPPKERKYE
jgi:hypothetical protein